MLKKEMREVLKIMSGMKKINLNSGIVRYSEEELDGANKNY